MRDTSATDTDEPEDFNTRDSTAFWRKEGQISVIAALPCRARWSLCLFSILAILLLTIIISISLTSAETVRSVSGLRHSLNSLQSQSQDFFTKLDHIENAMTQLKCRIRNFENNGTVPQCCPLDWKLYFSHCYYFSDDGKPWNDARDACVDMKADLLTLKNKEEKDFVFKNTRPFFYWLGLSDERTGEWEWVDGTPYQMDKREWMPGQPDNWKLHGLGGGEDCAHFHRDGRYNDDHCSRTYRFVCKSPAHTL